MSVYYKYISITRERSTIEWKIYQDIITKITRPTVRRMENQIESREQHDPNMAIVTTGCYIIHPAKFTQCNDDPCSIIHQHTEIYMYIRYQPTTFGQLRASWVTTCLHFLHFRLVGAFISLLFLILLDLPFEVISVGGCISTSFGILLPKKVSYSSCLSTVIAGVIFWRGSTRLDKLECKNSIPCFEFMAI